MTTATADPLKGLNSKEVLLHAQASPDDPRIAESVAYRQANWRIGSNQAKNLTRANRLHTEALEEAHTQATETVKKKGGRPRDVRTVNGRTVDYTTIREAAWKLRNAGHGSYRECVDYLCELEGVPTPS